MMYWVNNSVTVSTGVPYGVADDAWLSVGELGNPTVAIYSV